MRIALENARIFSAVRDNAIDDGTIVVDRDKIIWVGASAAPDRPAAERAVDCSGLVITPGLIDAHVHLIYNGVRDAYTIELERSLEEATIDAALHAKRLLELGITAIRDVGTRGNIAVVIRNAIYAGRLSGPRVKASKQIISVFGAGDIHPTHVFGRTPYRDALTEIITGPWQARDAVRLHVKDGADWIKAEASGTGFNPFCPAEVDTMSFEELRALCDEAGEKQRPVACHAESRRSIIKAAKAGCRTVEHAIYLDEDGTQALLDHDVAVCPTLGLYTAFVEKGLESGVPPEVVANHRRTHEKHVEAINTAFKAGVTIIAGSDSGLANFPQGGGLGEICGFVDVVGMTPAQALVSATRDAARVIGFDDAGTVELGKRADLVLYRGDPTVDIRVITDDAARVCVLQGGAVVAGALP